MASSDQDEADDGSIVWENPNTPANAKDYIFMDGKRYVRPYYFEFLSHVKKRWEGKQIVDVFTDEFKGRPPEYYVRAVESGRIRIEGRMVAPSFAVRDSQKMSHFVHRHEPPVMAKSVEILEEGPDVITVCKPASIPVHPCGQYRKNTVVGILEAEHNTGQLFPIHRLDRLVSGLLILARNAQTANLFRQEIEAGRVYKQYVAKVIGVFAEHKVEVNAAVIYNPREGISTVETEQLGAGKGKVACTRFQRLSTDGTFSIVRCEPVTGRTHQIRVHLQHLGHPIANDALYLQAHPPKRSMAGVYGDTAAKSARTMSSNAPSVAPVERISGVTTTEVKNSAVDSFKGEAYCSNSLDSSEETLKLHNVEGVSDSRTAPPNTDLCSTFETIGGSSGGTKEKANNQIEGNGRLFSVDMMCTHCPNLGPSGYKDDEGVWLHCVRYASPSWSYECPLPHWAL